MKKLILFIGMMALSGLVMADSSDTDLDGLPDAWEIAQFGDLTTSSGGSDNYDGDRNTDLEEYHAGTSATDPLDYFQTPLTATGSGTLEVTFDGASNRTYVLEISAELSPSNTWTYYDSIGPLLSNGPKTLVGTATGDPSSLFGRIQATADAYETPSTRYAPDGYSFVWGDHFGATTLDPEKWFVGMRDPVSGDINAGAANPNNGGGDWLLNDGYAGYVTVEDSFVEEGSLILRNQKRTYEGTSPARTFDYTSGWVQSRHRGFFNKCYIEVRAKFPSGDKVWPAIWMIAEDMVWGPEWDIWEYFGYRSDVGHDNMGTHLMTGLWNSQKWNSNWISSYDATYDCEAWHVYGWEWTDTEAVWTIDGVVVHSLQKSATKDPAAWPDEDMYIVLNNGVKTSSPDTTTTWPNRLQIDYIEVYQLAP